MKVGTLIVLIASVVAASIPNRAAELSDLPVLQPKVKTVAAFKNGLGFVLKIGEVNLRDGRAKVDGVPAASLGSLWFSTTSPDHPVTEVVAFKETTVDEEVASSQAELLAANAGKRVILTSSAGGALGRMEGTLLPIPQHRRRDQLAEGAPAHGRLGTEPTRSDIVLVRVTTNGRPSIVSLNRALVQGIEFIDEPKLTTQLERETQRARIRVAGDPKTAEVTMAYLGKGIVWSPSYRMDIARDVAVLSLEAVLASDFEDLEEADVSFVVGYPNFMFADVLSPLALRQSIGEFVQALAAGRPSAQTYGRLANVMEQSFVYNVARFEPGAGGGSYSPTEPMPGESNEDLYFYHQSGVTLKKGERGRFTVFTAEIPYEHIYQWEVRDSMNVDDRGYRRDDRTADAEDQVWHVLRVENTTRQPWTTAPAFVVNGAMPVAQAILGYAPPGGRSTLQLTVATDVRAGQVQRETARKPTTIAGRAVDEVTVTGALSLKNWKQKEVSVVVRKTLTGEVLGQNGGNVTKVAKNLTSVNPTSQIEWEFHLAPNEEKELTYEYKVLVHR